MQQLDGSLKFKSWKAELVKNGVAINSVTELKSIRKKNGEILFSLLNLDAKDSNGIPLLPVVMIRGHFVSVVTCITQKESKEKFLLLVGQLRVANGAIHWEHPAGMMDEEKDPWEVACKEVEEETGLRITKNQLKLLWPEKLFSTPGLLDEAGWFFSCELEMSEAELNALQNFSAGHGGEGEFIKTKIVPLEKAEEIIVNTNGLLGIFLFLQSNQPF